MENINFKRFEYDHNGTHEALLIRPDGEGPFPLVVLVHGHNKLGAWDNLYLGWLLKQKDIATLMPSMRGYGFIIEKPEPDFCGPQTVDAIQKAVEKILEKGYVDKGKIAIWGISRGATVASQIITKYPDFYKAAVLQSGVYDMKKEVEWSDLIPGIKDNMVKETSGDEKAWEERSSILNMDKLNSNTLILHGDQDDRVNVEQARILDKKLSELNKNHTTVILEGANHFIGRITRRKYTFPFLENELK